MDYEDNCAHLCAYIVHGERAHRNMQASHPTEIDGLLERCVCVQCIRRFVHSFVSVVTFCLKRFVKSICLEYEMRYFWLVRWNNSAELRLKQIAYIFYVFDEFREDVKIFY